MSKKAKSRRDTVVMAVRVDADIAEKCSSLADGDLPAWLRKAITTAAGVGSAGVTYDEGWRRGYSDATRIFRTALQQALGKLKE